MYVHIIADTDAAYACVYGRPTPHLRKEAVTGLLRS